MHAGDHAIHAVVLDRRQVRGDPHRVDGIDRQSGRDRKTVRTVGVVQQGETYAARFETERMPRPEIRAVQKNARMFDAVPVEFPDRRTDAFRSAVAAVVVGQYGNVHAQGVECLGQSRRGAEAGVTRIGSGFGKGGFEIDDRCIGRTEALPHPVERGIEIEIAFRRTRCGELGRMLHQVPGEDQPGTPYLREGWLGRYVDFGCPAPMRQRVGATDVKGAGCRQSDDCQNDDFRKFLHFPSKIRYGAELSKKLRRFASALMGAFRK